MNFGAEVILCLINIIIYCSICSLILCTEDVCWQNWESYCCLCCWFWIHLILSVTFVFGTKANGIFGNLFFSFSLSALAGMVLLLKHSHLKPKNEKKHFENNL